MRVRIAVGLLLMVLAAACGGQAAAPAASASASSAAEAVAGELTVFAAASLTDAFEELGARFEDANPATTVSFNFASSSTLATQITQGAPADVFASANQSQMDVVDDAGLLAAAPVDFAGNALEIAVEPGNPARIDGLADLAADDLTVVLAAEEVPAGEYARAALDAQGLGVEPASLEPDVRAVLSRVALGEADAGIVYASDVVAAGDEVDGVEIPGDQNVPASYPVAALTDASSPAVAAAFVDHLTTPEARAVLDEFGFSAP